VGIAQFGFAIAAINAWNLLNVGFRNPVPQKVWPRRTSSLRARQTSFDDARISEAHSGCAHARGRKAAPCRPNNSMS
jgi:hypothetical protein